MEITLGAGDLFMLLRERFIFQHENSERGGQHNVASVT